MELISAHHLTIEKRIHDISLTLSSGDILGIIGPNAAGKSTLLQALSGLIPVQGALYWQAQPVSTMPLKQRAQYLGYLPQTHHCAWPLKVKDIVRLGRAAYNESIQQQDKVIEPLMALAQVDQWAGRTIHELSGGEQARVWLCRVLAGMPQVIMADEPIAHLDPFYQHHLLQLLQKQSIAKACVLVLHDLSLAARYCTRLALLDQGQLIKIGSVKEVLEPTLLSTIYRVNMAIDTQTFPPRVEVKCPFN